MQPPTDIDPQTSRFSETKTSPVDIERCPRRTELAAAHIPLSTRAQPAILRFDLATMSLENAESLPTENGPASMALEPHEVTPKHSECPPTENDDPVCAQSAMDMEFPAKSE
jgi:hypothetical protein